MTNQPVLSIIIPAYNESQSIGSLLTNLCPIAENNNWEVIVVDDGSTDDTKTILSDLQNVGMFKIIKHKVNKGYGAAIKSGINNAGAPYVITIDADGQHKIEDVANLYNICIKSDADMVVGSRKGHKDGSVFRKIGKTSIRFIAKRLMPLKIHDINSGMKIYRTDLAKKYISLCPDTMSYSDTILLSFVYQRHLVLEEPISINQRVSGKSTVSISTAIETIIEIMNIVVLFNPMRIFFPVALIFFITGFLWGIPFLINGRGVSVGSGILMIMAVMIFLLSLIAEQLSTINRNMNK